jgi:hypothetical protein
MLYTDREVPQPLARGVEDRVGDRSRCADHRDLAQAFEADGIRQWIGLVDEAEFNLWRVC